MTLTPAARDFLRDLYTQRGTYEYRAGHPLEAAKATAFEVVEALRQGMLDGTFVALDGERCVGEAQSVQIEQHEQRGLW